MGIETKKKEKKNYDESRECWCGYCWTCCAFLGK